MNYIELINNFWRIDDGTQFTGWETKLYFYLVKTANGLGWVNEFWHSDAKVSANVGMSINTMKTSRNRLKQFGLINFKEGGKGYGDKTRYQILTPNSIPNLTPKSKEIDVQEISYQILTPNLQPNPLPNLQPNLQPNPLPNLQPLNKLNETKLNETKIEKEEEISKEILLTQFQNENLELSKKLEELSQALDEEKKKKERKSSAKKKEVEPTEKEKRPHGEHQNVFLLDAEVETLVKNNGMEVCNMAVDKLSNYKLASGKKYKSDYAAINQWVLESVQKTINERRIQGNIIKKTEQNEQQHRKGETSGDYLKRVGSGLDEIFNIRFGRTSNQPADDSENVSNDYSEFSIVS